MYKDDGIVDAMMGLTGGILGIIVMIIIAIVSAVTKPKELEVMETLTLPDDMINI